MHAGSVALELPGRLPPALLTALAVQRTALPVGGGGNVRVYRHLGAVRVGPYAVDLESYREGRYATLNKLVDTLATRRVGDAARRHIRMRREAMERR